MRLETLTDPTAEPLLLAEVKDHLRLDGSVEDAALGALISAARDMVERHLGLALTDRQVAVYLDAWPGETADGSPWWSGVRDGAIPALSTACHFVRLPVRPVSAIADVTILAADGTGSIWDASNYYLKPGHQPGLYRKQGAAWPAPGQVADGIRITVTAGFGPSWNDVPAAIRQALLMLVAHLYSHRGDDQGEALGASGAAQILLPYRERRL
ncbi:head-tail connector protein [Kordiimonas marina]|uniref:head-tail connector protein n=1 Tax=Kordiimonas marina TaxID=2872312 RepID=UPI001FF42256|nr:head-tail connector protein [Kordiimonas marina]MCJ9428689.1 head-tail connector protein [Kordiimonas marina]